MTPTIDHLAYWVHVIPAHVKMRTRALWKMTVPSNVIVDQAFTDNTVLKQVFILTMQNI